MLGGGGGSVGEEEAGPPGLLGSGGENEAARGGGGEGGGGGGGGEERGGSFFGSGNRWPRQETLALLKIRSDMDAAFRDSSAKGPLWEEVSRKLAELGYHRRANKCKEKFENVFKYHKRTREGRSGKQDGKTYRFFDQLEAFDNHPQIASAPPPQPLRASMVPPPGMLVTAAIPNPPTIPTVPLAGTQTTVRNSGTTPADYLSSTLQPISNPTTALPPPLANPSNPFPTMPKDLHSNSTSSSTYSDEGLRGGGGGGGSNGRRKRKRKWKEFFERLMKEVMDKQEELQSKFLEAIDKHEHDRLVREESWRMQEMARINREREILAQERSMAAAKETAVMAFLQKIAKQQAGPAQNTDNILSVSNPPPPTGQPPPPQPQVQLQPVILPVSVQAPPPPANVNIEFRKSDNGNSFVGPPAATSSRWPKVEVEALIRLRTNLDSKYEENGPKGPLWEEISAQMRKLGYQRSAKRCKEKWENINKYFKKVKESNKKRREDSKTCPYFQSLDAIYREKSSKIMDVTPLMVTPEQQWPPQQDHPQQDPVPMDNIESEQMDHSLDEEHGGGGHDEDEEEDGGESEIVAASRPSTNGDTQ